MADGLGSKPSQRGSQARSVLGHEVESERLDGHESIAALVVGAKDRSQNATANLMEDAERAKGRRRGQTRSII